MGEEKGAGSVPMSRGAWSSRAPGGGRVPSELSHPKAERVGCLSPAYGGSYGVSVCSE